MGLRQLYVNLSHRNDNLKHSIAGAGAGCVSSIVTCPLDVAKTRLQNQGVPIPGILQYKGTVGTLARIWREEGIRGLYRGLGPTVFGYLPTWAIYFSAYDFSKTRIAQYLGRGGGGGDWVVHILGAMIAGATSTTLTSPLWVIRTRLMTQSDYTSYRYRSTLHAFMSIFRDEGIRGFYKGLGPSLIGVSHVAVQFPLYEQLKIWLRSPNQDSTTFQILIASSLSKMTASVATYPHEVIRTRLQNQTIPPFKYQGILHGVKVMMQEEGWRAFYKGMPTNLVRTVPASALTILTYELLVRQLSLLEEEARA
ncbi:uncharacterized protein VTP21DRAFT_4319 [Calcarisporiella thermophila]|uniref:uncharacterized protein n=1 Tax=Calcarisporiella thermophila TaxID=911321 RepID=UPI0037434178